MSSTTYGLLVSIATVAVIVLLVCLFFWFVFHLIKITNNEINPKYDISKQDPTPTINIADIYKYIDAAAADLLIDEPGPPEDSYATTVTYNKAIKNYMTTLKNLIYKHTQST